MKKYLFITLLTITLFATVTHLGDDFVDRLLISIDSEIILTQNRNMKML
jgi:thioredoxin-related protein